MNIHRLKKLKSGKSSIYLKIWVFGILFARLEKALKLHFIDLYTLTRPRKPDYPSFTFMHVVERKAKLERCTENRLILSLPSNEFAHLKIPLESIISATNNFDEENAIGENGIEKRYTGQLLWSGELIDITARRFNKEAPQRICSPTRLPLQNNPIHRPNNFAEENVIREYEFVKEYKGQLLWSGELIDITAKRFNKDTTDREQVFWMEISMLSRLKHKNVVSLFGFCDENDEKIIIIRNETARGMLIE
ncbi:kinase-like domain, phloem protein 2-like protein [Tanacetum coccineum]